MSTRFTIHICIRCSRYFIPTPISSTATTLYCPHCHHSTTPPPPPTPPTSQTLFPPLSTSQFINSVQNAQLEDIPFNLIDGTFSYEPPPNPAATSFINSLKNHTLDRHILKQLHTSSSSCAICLEEFKLGEGVNRLPCRHWFHCDCVRTWLNLKNNCPLCRHEFPSEASNSKCCSLTSERSSTTSAVQPGQVRVRRTARTRTGEWIPNRRLAEDNLNSYSRIHILDD